MALFKPRDPKNETNIAKYMSSTTSIKVVVIARSDPMNKLRRLAASLNVDDDEDDGMDVSVLINHDDGEYPDPQRSWRWRALKSKQTDAQGIVRILVDWCASVDSKLDIALSVDRKRSADFARFVDELQPLQWVALSKFPKWVQDAIAAGTPLNRIVSRDEDDTTGSSSGAGGRAKRRKTA